MTPEETSAAALRSLNRNASRTAVHNCIHALGPIHDEDIAIVLDMNPSTARPRRHELMKAGLIENAGTGYTKSGSKAILWREVPGKVLWKVEKP